MHMQLRDDLIKEKLDVPIVVLNNPTEEKVNPKWLGDIFPVNEKFYEVLRMEEEESYATGLGGEFSTLIIHKGWIFLCVGFDFDYF